MGIFLRNLLAWALCVCAAAGLVVPAGYVVIKAVINEQTGKPPLFSPPVTSTLVAVTVCVCVATLILIVGYFLVKLSSLWTAAAIVMAFPALHIATKLIREHLHAKFLEAWQPLVIVPDWGWWTAFGISLVLYLFCGSFGPHTPAQPITTSGVDPTPKKK